MMLDAQLLQRPETYDSLATDNDDIRKQLKIALKKRFFGRYLVPHLAGSRDTITSST